MSHWHGGFWLHRVGAEIVEPVHGAVVRYFEHEKLDASEKRLTFTSREGAPVVHVAVRGGDADGKGYNTWNLEHSAIGGALANALSCDVWAYAYEDSCGSESVVHFDASGNELSRVDQGWDDFGESSGLDSEDSEFWERLPLGKLANELGLARHDLTTLLPYDTPDASVALDQSPNFDEAKVYLTRGLMPMPDELRENEVFRELFFPPTTAAEVRDVARRLGVRLGDVLFAAWTLAVPALYGKAPDLVAPKARLPSFLHLRDEGDVPAPARASSGKVALVLALPRACATQIGELANALDNAHSYVLQLAWREARSALFRAERAHDDGASAEETTTFKVFFPSEMWQEDVASCARALRLRPEELLTVAWELAKATIAELPGLAEEEGGEDAAPKVSAPCLPSELDIPDVAQADAGPKGGEKLGVDLEMPSATAAEIGAISDHLDRSRSWVLQKAWSSTRARLLAAKRIDTRRAANIDRT